MKIQTLSIVVGSGSCDAHCKFCVSRMTGREPGKAPEINWKRFDVACRLAERAGCTAAMITGKGEPTLFPEQVSEVISHLRNRFPLVELQTNGIRIARNRLIEAAKYAEGEEHDWVSCWVGNGLTTVGVSVVHYEKERNIEIYTPDTNWHFDLAELVKKLHGYGLSVRLCCVMLRGYIDNWERVQEFIQFAKAQDVEQLTFTPVNMPAVSSDLAAERFTSSVILATSERKAIEFSLHEHQHIMTLPHGAKVFDVNGQNVCLNNCLSPQPSDMESLRNLIFMPDGHLYYKWDCEGAIII